MIYELKHTDTTDNKIITELSNRFSELLCEHLGDDIIKKVIQDNKTSKYGCNSNDYCDANQIMIDALDYVFGEYWELSDDDIHNLINASWTMSMKNEFKQDEPQNPYLDWAEDSIGDALFELREWIVEQWLIDQKDEFQHSECLGSDPLNNPDCGFEQYNKYNLLQDAMEKLNEKESK